MSYRREGKQVVLEMSAEEYDLLLSMLGYALGARRAMGDEEDAELDRWIVFVNNLNAANPRFMPYAIPE